MSILNDGIRTERLIIRNPQPEDLDGWHRQFSDRANMYYLQDICTDSLEETRERLNNAIEQSRAYDRTRYFLTVELAETDEYIGGTGYTVEKETPAGKTVHAGYFYLPGYHGKGYATEALRAVIRFAFEEGGVYLFKTGLFAENKASERVMQKCGLIKDTGYKEQARLDGRWCDRLAYQLLKPEWLVIP
ncbi:MAG: GNAT family N-acetyltransferase [Clostridiales bacterium]|jgi:ribosomal-protein-alanine N-acetyltransferase|nr:GNAT family N-acetyltransferase [Clostridiales bacterium]